MGGNIYILLIIQKFKINFLRGESYRFILKKHRIQFTFQSYRLNAGFIVCALPLGGRIQKIDFCYGLNT